MVTPHDAEEAMRPYLARIYEADAALEGVLSRTSRHEEAVDVLLTAQDEALDKALELLGVQR